MNAQASEERPGQRLSEPERLALLSVAREALEAAAHGRAFPDPDPSRFAPGLGATLACFVTLEKDGELRGCIGTLSARLPLVVEVAHMARAAALNDPRFAPLSSDELGGLEISISVLSVPEPMRFGSEQELLEQLRPGVDGLILRDHGHSGTFLPSVWDKLPLARDFLNQLKRKAGLPTSHWSPSVRVERYTTECFSGSWWS